MEPVKRPKQCQRKDIDNASAEEPRTSRKWNGAHFLQAHQMLVGFLLS